MPDTVFTRSTHRMDCLGLDLNRPVDSVKASKFPYLKNCRSYQFGRIEPRNGLTDIGIPAAGQNQVHSIRRLNDEMNGVWARIIGTGTHLAIGTYTPNPFQDVDSGYSGNPLALVPWRPDQSPSAWMYVGDSLRSRKINAQGQMDSVGYAPPMLPPVVALADAPKYRNVDDFWPNASGGTDWFYPGPLPAGATSPFVASTNTAGAVDANGNPFPPPAFPPPNGIGGPPHLLSGLSSIGERTSGHIQYILYDNVVEGTGWANITLDTMTGTVPLTGGNSLPAVGQRIALLAGGGPSATDEIPVVQSVRPGAGVGTLGQNPITIAAIQYDIPGGAVENIAQPCSIVLSAPVDQVDVDGLVHNVVTGDLARITTVISGPDGTTSIRAGTFTTWAAGQQVEVLPTFRCYCQFNHFASGPGSAGTIAASDGVRFVVYAVPVTAGGQAGNGWIDRIVDEDLSLIQPGFAVQPEDIMAISVRVDHPELLTELKVQLDVDAKTNDFTANYYTRSFRPSDLTPSLNNLESTITTRQGVISNQITNQPIITQPTDIAGTNPPAPDNPNQLLQVTTPATSDTAVSQQMESGQPVWNALGFRISDLTRVGTDDTRTLANVKRLRILAMVTGTVTIDLDGWWIGGGYGPDTMDATTVPYVYRYRVRNAATGVSSNPSPASRTGVEPRRQAVHVLVPLYQPGAGSVPPQNLTIDIERFGGAIADWHYVGSLPNTLTVVGAGGLTDTFADDIVAALPQLGLNNWQPWPIIMPPIGTTGATASGTLLYDPGAHFNVAWAPGTAIGVGGAVFTVYRMLSTTLLETVENMGYRPNIDWAIQEPTVMGQPLPCMWGDEQLGAFFACGDSVNPGRLYFSTGNNPDNTAEANWLDITSPSEPLMNGVVYNLRSYVFSSERMFQIMRTGNLAIPWTAQEIPNGKGLFARWAITREPAPQIYFLSKDGILATAGGASVPLTDADLYPLLPNEGNPGQDTNGIGAPAISAATNHFLRLSYYDEFLYFDYPVINPVTSAVGVATLILAGDVGAAERGSAPGGWFWDVYSVQTVFHYGEEGPNVHALLLGGADGHLYGYSGPDDAGQPFPMEFTTPSDDGGDPRSLKMYQDVLLDTSTDGLDVAVTPYVDNDTAPAPAGATTINSIVRKQFSIPFGSTQPLARNASGITARNYSLFVHCMISGGHRPMFYIWEGRWTFDAAPLAAGMWEIAPTSSGLPNWKHFGLFRISYISAVGVDVDIWIDGVRQPTIILPPASDYHMEVFRVPVMKFKLWNVRVSAEGDGNTMRLDTRDSFIQLKEWGSNDAYRHFRVLDDFAMVEG